AFFFFISRVLVLPSKPHQEYPTMFTLPNLKSLGGFLAVRLSAALALLGAALPAAAQDAASVDSLMARVAALEEASSGVDTGSNAFIMICAALVLFMTLPGLALFYGGLVRSKNILSVL